MLSAIGSNDCTVCLVQGVTVIPRPPGPRPVKGQKRAPDCPWRKKKIFNYHTVTNDSRTTIDPFDFDEVFFDTVKYLGFNCLHKLMRVTENFCSMCEVKYAFNHTFDLFCSDPSAAISEAHQHIQNQFHSLLGIKYCVPDPINGGKYTEGSRLVNHPVVEPGHYIS